MTTGERLLHTISIFAERENELLKEHFKKGIFDMPELGFAYEVGKRIALDAERHFGSAKYNWVREIDLKNGGPTDLVFLSSDNTAKNYAFEFKMDNTAQAYAADIQKLRALASRTDTGQTWEKYFCALKWVLHKSQGDAFLASLKNEFGNAAKLVGRSGFPCLVVDPTKPQYCLITLWKVTYE